MTDHSFMGLTNEQVEERRQKGLSNQYDSDPSKSTGAIIRQNIFTLFNLINFILAFLLLLVGSYSNMVFILIIILNIVIGIVQEIRARNMVQSLSIVSEKYILAIRDGKEINIPPSELVIDDLIYIDRGDQVPTDVKVVKGNAEVNESLLTGESDAIHKKWNDTLFSGSYLTSGKVLAQVVHVGKDNYATQLVDQTKQDKPLHSELIGSIRKVSKFTSYVIIPLGLVLFAEAILINNVDITNSVVTTVASLIGMLPKGLVLLITVALSSAVIKLGKEQVLTQNMYAVENLAHADVLALDKTGTLTEGKMAVETVQALHQYTNEDVITFMGAYLNASEDNNVTSQAMREYFKTSDNFHLTDILPFSSDRKWGAASFEQLGTLYFGSAENILANNQIPIEVVEGQENGSRVLLLAISQSAITKDLRPSDVEPVGVISLSDPVRKNAEKTLSFFEKQGVELKLISGDNPQTVANIAKKVGFKNYQNYVDLSQFETESEVREAANKYSVYGRVTPEQKKILVEEMQNAGQTVAMTGDGVNDVLSLRQADVSIAMASGDPASQQIADIVLMDSDFDHLPKVIYEERRVVNNITRSAGIFFIKTLYSLFVSIICAITLMQFPFIPLQITLMDAFIEAYPSFVLSMEGNPERIRKPFLSSALGQSLPSAIVITLDVVLMMVVQTLGLMNHTDAHAVTYYLLIAISSLALIKSCYPFNALRTIVMTTAITGIFTTTYIFSNMVEVAHLNSQSGIVFLIVFAFSTVLWIFLNKHIEKFEHYIEKIPLFSSKN